MKKTYITTLPDHIGTFLKASKCFAELGMNITRCSYNKAVDINTLFIDAEGSAAQHEAARKQLEEIGYLQEHQDKNVVLLEFKLKDQPGVVVGILELISEFRFNISYMSSQENGSDFQLFKMGLFVEEPSRLEEFLKKASTLCQVRVIDYNHSERVYDNSIFYNSFVSDLTRNMDLPDEARDELLINTNLAMQTLDESGLSPYKTFDSISKFAGLLAEGRGEKFIPRISSARITDNTDIITIEPPCGSNTAIIRSGSEYLFVDSGYACYREEMLKIFEKIIPDYKGMKKRILITHADVDHVGLLDEFDEIILNSKSARSLTLEAEGKDDLREHNPLHKPYIRMIKLLTSHKKADPKKFSVLWQSPEGIKPPLVQIGFFSFGDLNFEVYEGAGGHIAGEMIFIDYEHHVALTGDVYVNLKNMTPRQAEYNKCAPILMTSVDTNPELCALERKAFFDRLGLGAWQIFGAHGAKTDYELKKN